MAEAPLPDAARAALRRLGIERLMGALPRTSAAAGVALLGAAGALHQLGWPRSFAARIPIDRDGAPLPWFTYPAIALLAPRLRPTLRVFEYGAGNSTRWWAARVATVRSVEHDEAWVARLRADLPNNARVEFQPLQGSDGGERYVSAAGRCAEAEGAAFDVVVIDGRERNRCVPATLRALSAGGVVVWDNSERPRYEPGLASLAGAGFRRIDLHGLGPVNPYGWCTSVLYRDGNVFGL